MHDEQHIPPSPEPDDDPSDHMNTRGAALPTPSQTPHVTISGGTLGGFDVVRSVDTQMPTPDPIEVGATVQLVDGVRAEVVEVHGNRLSRIGKIGGSLKVRFENGETVRISDRAVAAVIKPPQARRG